MSYIKVKSPHVGNSWAMVTLKGYIYDLEISIGGFEDDEFDRVIFNSK